MKKQEEIEIPEQDLKQDQNRLAVDSLNESIFDILTSISSVTDAMSLACANGKTKLVKYMLDKWGNQCCVPTNLFSSFQ